jgi:uncharacterized protein YbjT (DUF2867 family)
LDVTIAVFPAHVAGKSGDAPPTSLAPALVIIRPVRILVTGASGFVGSLLLPRLLTAGHDVRGMAREPERVPAIAAGAEIVRGDALSGEGLASALARVDVAYYLIHSMERTQGTHGRGARFEERDRVAAENFAASAARAHVGRIVYLGGLLGDARGQARSRHLRSRASVERALLDAVPDSVALRASIVIGARSRSFRLLVHLVERMRVLALPAWRTFRTQPIDERDLIEMLLGCARAPLGGRSLDVGGPDVLSYGEMVERIAELMLVSRPSLGIGISATAVTARVAAAIAREDPDLVLPLMESLYSDLLPHDGGAAELLGVRLHSFDSAVEHALGEWERTERLAAR